VKARVSIRLRLTLWYSAVLLFGLVLFGVAVWVALEHRLMTGVDTRLSDRVESLRTVLQVEGWNSDRKYLQEELAEFAQEIPEGALIEVWDSTGAPVLPVNRNPLVARVATTRPAYRTIVQEGRQLRVLSSKIEHGVDFYDVQVASSLEDVHVVMNDLRNLLVFLIPAVLMVACLGGYWLSRRALAPVDEITRVAKSISVQNLSQRLTVPRTGDEIQRMAEAWNGLLDRLEGSVKRIRQFTADASHELRTPLALIRTTAELALRRERQTSDYQSALREIQMEAERMTELTESLLTVARADANGLELPLAEIDINETIWDVVRQIDRVAAAQGVAMRTELTKEPAKVQANAPAIRRLLLGLVDNALKHTPSGGSITISTTREQKDVVLAVQDTGEGIQAEALPHVFERFFRSDPARSSGSGAGLGLSIAEAVAQAHRSEIMVQSKPGAGARFELVLRS
jgi:two-component system, OmpR family, heavy metal sensor histidine kinase CusS